MNNMPGLQMPATRPGLANIHLAIGLEALYQPAREAKFKEGEILARERFMTLGFVICVGPAGMIQTMQAGIAHMPVQVGPNQSNKRTGKPRPSEWQTGTDQALVP